MFSNASNSQQYEFDTCHVLLPLEKGSMSNVSGLEPID